MTLQMTGRINGYQVGFTKRDQSHEKHVPLLEPVYNMRSTSQDLGPKATKVQVEGFYDGDDHESVLRRVLGNMLAEPFLVLEDAPDIYYNLSHVFLRAPQFDKKRRGLSFSEFTLAGILVGNNASHDLQEVLTAAQVTNEWTLPGVVAARIPFGTSLQTEAITDALRRVLQSPVAFATHEAQYLAGNRTRNSASPLVCAIDTPSSLWTGRVLAKDAAGLVLEGMGHDLAGGTLENVALRVLFNVVTDRLTYTDLLYGATSLDLLLDAFAHTYHSNVGLPAHARRHVVHVDTPKRGTLTVLDNGVTHFRPKGGAVTINPAPANRSFGGSTFYHSLGANTYLVSNYDFSIAAGVISYGVATLGVEVLVNGDFESYPTSPGIPSSWTNLAGNSSQMTKETALIASGSAALKVTSDASTTTPGVKQTLTGLTVGANYIAKVRARTDGQAASQARLQIFNVTDAVAALTVDGVAGRTFYETLRGTFVPAAGKTYEVRLFNPAAVASEIVYFDLASVLLNGGQQANTTNPDAIFSVIFTNAAGTALDKRLREAFTEPLVDWFLEPK